MINGRIIFVVCLVIGIGDFKEVGSPTNTNDLATQNNTTLTEDDEFYDQRQNGTENYRLKVSNLQFFLAPMEAALAGALMSDKFDSLGLKNKNHPDQSDGAECTGEKCKSDESQAPCLWNLCINSYDTVPIQCKLSDFEIDGFNAHQSVQLKELYFSSSSTTILSQINKLV